MFPLSTGTVTRKFDKMTAGTAPLPRPTSATIVTPAMESVKLSSGRPIGNIPSHWGYSVAYIERLYNGAVVP